MASDEARRRSNNVRQRNLNMIGDLLITVTDLLITVTDLIFDPTLRPWSHHIRNHHPSMTPTATDRHRISNGSTRQLRNCRSCTRHHCRHHIRIRLRRTLHHRNISNQPYPTPSYSPPPQYMAATSSWYCQSSQISPLQQHHQTATYVFDELAERKEVCKGPNCEFSVFDEMQGIRMQPPFSETKSLSIKQGSGMKLHAISNVVFKPSKRRVHENLEALHTLLFGRKSNVHKLKRSIFQSSGFVWSENEEKLERLLKNANVSTESPLLLVSSTQQHNLVNQYAADNLVVFVNKSCDMGSHVKENIFASCFSQGPQDLNLLASKGLAVSISTGETQMPSVSTISMDEMSSTSTSADTKFYPITAQATQPGEAGDENMTDLSGTVNKQLMEFACNFMDASMQETSQVGDTGNQQDECLDKFHGGEVDGELKMMAVAKISDTWTGALNMLPNAVAVELTLESKTRETVFREIGLGFERSLFNKEVFGGMFSVVKLHHGSHADESVVNAKEFSASTNIDSGLDMFASAYPFLEELRLKRMTVSAENLEYLLRSISGFKALSLVSCYGFNTNGLASIISYCRNLVELVEEEVLADACRAMPYLFEGTNDKIQTVIEVVVCPRLMELLLLPSHIFLIPTLRTVRNIVTGDVYFSSTYVSASFHVWIWDPGSAIHRRGCNCNMHSGEELRMVWDPGIYIIELGNIPHITLCDTGSPRKNVGMGIPANNKGERNIVCLLWLSTSNSTSISPIASFHIFGVDSRDQIP